MTDQATLPKPARAVKEHPEVDPSTGFDMRTHIIDANTGRLIRLQTYARHAKGDKVLFERPIGSGNCWYENGQSAGRWTFKDHDGNLEWKQVSKEHVATKAAPVNHAEDLEQRNETLEAELEALRAELAAQQAHQSEKQQAHTQAQAQKK